MTVVRPLWLLPLLLALPCLPAHAVISASPQNPMLAEDWPADWDSELLLSQSFCVDSRRGGGGGPPGGPPGGGPPGGGQQQPYDVTATGPFQLTANGEVLPFSATWVDTDRNVSYSLQADQPTPRELAGNAANCDNALLQLTFLESDLRSRLPGSYTGNLQITLAQDEAGQAPHSVVIDAAITVNIPDRIRISGLNDIDLGTFDGVSDLVGIDQVCIYRASGGTYTVTLTGDGSGSSFRLSNSDSTIPYSVRWSDGGGFSAVEAGSPLSGQQAGSFAGDTDCSGARNASVEVEVSAADASEARPGPHTGVLTILVEME